MHGWNLLLKLVPANSMSSYFRFKICVYVLYPCLLSHFGCLQWFVGRIQDLKPSIKLAKFPEICCILWCMILYALILKCALKEKYHMLLNLLCTGPTGLPLVLVLLHCIALKILLPLSPDGALLSFQDYPKSAHSPKVIHLHLPLSMLPLLT